MQETLVGWQAAGITCAEPSVGMPGPAADWHCEADADGLRVAIRLIVDSFGVQSIHVGVPGSTDRALAARAFVDVVEATSIMAAARSEIADWLRATEAADGSMPKASPPVVGRVHVDSTDPRQITLFLIPINSSIMSVSGMGDVREHCYRDAVVTSDPVHCCDSMTYHAEYICPDMVAIHDGDPLRCPDRLALRRPDGSYGLLIHDGGSSSIDISFCPWCGRPLPSGDIQRR